MKISKKSWHYKFMELVGVDMFDIEYGRVTLCQYMRTLMWAFTKGFLTLLALILLLNSILFLVTGVMGHPVGWIDYPAAIIFIYCVSGLSLFYSGCGVYDGTVEVVPSYLKPNKTISIKKVKYPSIFKEWYTAYKDKFCPIVEVVDE